MEKNNTLNSWLYTFVNETYKVYGTRLWGGNAYLYKTVSGYLCCALLYSKPEIEWVEIATRNVFKASQISSDVLDAFSEKVICVDISQLLYIAIKKFNSLGEEMHMFNLFKLAKAAQTAQTTFNIIDDVNSTYNTSYEDGAPLSIYAHDTSKSGSDRAMAAVRATVNQDWFDLAKLGISELINLVSKDPLPYEHYLMAISQYLDVKIQQFSKEENLRFVGGECTITVEKKEKKVVSNAQMYFKNSNNKWVVKEMKGNTGFHCFTAETLDNEITEIMLDGGRKFPITAPGK